MVQTCLDAFGLNGKGGALNEWPAGPVLSLVISVVFLAIRGRLSYLLSLVPDESKIKEPFYGLTMGSFWRQLCGVFICLNLPSLLLFKIFRDLPAVLETPFLKSNALEFACFNQNGDELGPGDYISILNVLLLLAVLLNTNRRVKTRWTMVDRLGSAGLLAPPPCCPASSTSTSTSTHTRRIALLPIGSGVWVTPFVKRFCEDAAQQASGPKVECDCVCLDNFGAPTSDFLDDSWLRLNLKLDEGGYVPAHTTLKVYAAAPDFSSLPLPDDCIDIFVLPTGTHLPAVAALRGREEEQQALLDAVLREIARCLRPGGRVVSSTMKNVGNQQEQWEKACTAAGLEFGSFPEPEIPQWVGYLPMRLRLLFLPDARGVGTGKHGWLPDHVYWSIFPAYMHSASKPLSSSSTLGTADVIPPLVDVPLPTPPPLLHDAGNRSVSDREDRDWFPPGAQFRLVEGLVLLRLWVWLASIVLVWVYLPHFQVLDFLPYDKQLISFLMSLIGISPILLYFHAEELREAAKSKGLDVSPSVLRAKVWQKVAEQRFTTLLMICFIAITWLPYFTLDCILIKFQGQSVSEVKNVNTYIGVAIGVTLGLGAPRFATYYAKLMRDNAKLAAQQQLEKEQQQEKEEREIKDREIGVEVFSPVIREGGDLA